MAGISGGKDSSAMLYLLQELVCSHLFIFLSVSESIYLCSRFLSYSALFIVLIELRDFRRLPSLLTQDITRLIFLHVLRRLLNLSMSTTRYHISFCNIFFG